jgi:DNA polymerase-3 subunit delta'
MLGQSHIVATLRDAAARGALHHAYLFVGQEGLGQEEMARWLAMLANCEAEGERPCGACHTCHLTQSNANPDVLWVAPGDRSKVGRILLEQAQQIRSDVSRRPVIGKRKVVVISPADALTADAVNCLLKTLEEPPEYAILVLLASDTANVLPTILSRCQVLRFVPVPEPDLKAFLLANGADEETAGNVARLAQGRPEAALRLLREPALLAARADAIAWAGSVSRSALPDALKLAEDLRATNEGGDIEWTLQWAATWFRDILAVQAGAEDAVLNTDARDALLRAAAVYPAGQPVECVESIHRTRRYLAGNANKDLATEVLVFDLIPRRGAGS